MSEPAHPDDKPLGRADAVARLFEEHNRALVRYLAVRLQSVQEAKEIAQEAYVRLLQLDKPEVESFLKNYLYRVATNLAVDRLRQRGRWKTVEWAADCSLDDGFDGPEREASAREELLAVTVGLSELPRNCREAFLKFRLDGMGQMQICCNSRCSFTLAENRMETDSGCGCEEPLDSTRTRSSLRYSFRRAIPNRSLFSGICMRCCEINISRSTCCISVAEDTIL